MLARDLMTEHPHFVSPTTPLRTAIDLMEERGIRHLPVIEMGRLVGVLSDRDVRAYLPSTAAGQELSETWSERLEAPVTGAMGHDPIYVGSDVDEADVIALMLEWRIGSVPVVDDGVLVGILTWVDLLRRSGERLATQAGDAEATPYADAVDVAMNHNDALYVVTRELAEQGFGVLSTIDVQATMKKKLDLATEPHTILGACNPTLAHEAMSAEHAIGVLLPCNVDVRQLAEGLQRVYITRPEALFSLIDNPGMGEIATQVGDKLRTVAKALHGATAGGGD